MRILGTSLLMMVLIAGCAPSPTDSSEEPAAAISGELTTAQCNAYNGNVDGCNAAGCAYYLCSNQCHVPGTSNCDAGCSEFCTTGCRAYDGNVNGCNAAGCAYYYCSNQCHPSGTSNCGAGCSEFCSTTNTYNYISECPSPSGGRYSYADVDAWNFYKCECTSYAADKLNERGISFHNYYLGVHWGDASNWVNAAQTAGVSVSTTPQVGDVAWWNGHVAHVDSVNADGSVNISEYNWGNAWDFHKRSNVRATYYIHF
ncbi:MAG TPA: CHAP domain-containing protein [Myxococcaceae bacterium]|nr:CHAP domain-containing protein [Myxococcaceae bacterium]